MSDESFGALLGSLPLDPAQLSDGSPDAVGGSDPTPEHANDSDPSSAGVLKRGISYAHDQMIDLVLANPGISQGEIARLLGYSEGWISQIFNSDVFQSRLASRRDALIDPSIQKQIAEGLDGLIQRSLSILKEKLDLPSNLVSDQLAVRSLEIASRARGYGARVDEPKQTNVNVNVHLEQLGDGLTHLLRRRKAEVIEAEPADRRLSIEPGVPSNA